ncbi:MAG: hypothetical protein U0840_02605 [Gemmataceae bacterium]
MNRLLCFLLLAYTFSLAPGCGSSAPTGPNLSEEERKKHIQQDVQNIQKERQGPTKKP